MISLQILLQLLGFAALIIGQFVYFIIKLSKLEATMSVKTQELERRIEDFSTIEEKLMQSHKELHEKIDHQGDKMLKLIHENTIALTELKGGFKQLAEVLKELKDDFKNS